MSTEGPRPPSTNPNLEVARAYLATQPIPGRVLLCGVTGAHHYGFPSPDSDLDLKGVHLARTESLLGLTRPSETWDRTEFHEGIECDLTSHEAGKALGLLLRGNGNMLERVLSPFQVVETAELSELRSLARASIGRHFYGHYRGYLQGMRREHEREPRTKSMLYTYRVALTGIHLLTTGELEADVRVNAPRYGLPRVLELVRRKAVEPEKGALPAHLDEEFRAGWPDLEERLANARDESTLPEDAPNAAAFDEWLIRARRSDLLE